MSLAKNVERDNQLLYKKLAPTERKWDSLNTILKGEDLNETYRDSIKELFSKNKEKQKEVYKTFIRENPKSLVSVETLSKFKPTFGKVTTAELFKSLDGNIQKSEAGNEIKTFLEFYNEPEIGEQFKDFALPNLQGEKVVLSENLQDYTLLEFWAAWCGPCRKAHPDFLKVYEKYKQNGFTIIGVSVDHDQKDWKVAVESDELTWINLWNEDGWDSKVQYLYGVNKLSMNFLIGPDGKIIAKNVRPDELEALLKKKLMRTAHNNI